MLLRAAYSEVLHRGAVVVLRAQACVTQVAGAQRPFAQASVIECFQLVGNDKRHYPALQTLLEHNKPAHAAVAVLERMYQLEAMMKVEDVVY